MYRQGHHISDAQQGVGGTHLDAGFWAVLVDFAHKHVAGLISAGQQVGGGGKEAHVHDLQGSGKGDANCTLLVWGARRSGLRRVIWFIEEGEAVLAHGRHVERLPGAECCVWESRQRCPLTHLYTPPHLHLHLCMALLTYRHGLYTLGSGKKVDKRFLASLLIRSFICTLLRALSIRQKICIYI